MSGVSYDFLAHRAGFAKLISAKYLVDTLRVPYDSGLEIVTIEMVGKYLIILFPDFILVCFTGF